ncbi:flagellar hook-basal body complex protein FliE [Salinarimonas sp.]|uniref:flagellar hook-basal body complex protein FliE n=1 Tax=Salinarimonas sp. TaxID=2766526 RepID=UPI003918C210
MIDATSSLNAVGIGGTGAARAIERIAPTAGAGAVSGLDFGAVLTDVASKGVSAIANAEAASIKGIRGEASIQQVVEAVLEAERTLQTAIAVRDKVVQAYQEISRMAI